MYSIFLSTFIQERGATSLFLYLFKNLYNCLKMQTINDRMK